MSKITNKKASRASSNPAKLQPNTIVPPTTNAIGLNEDSFQNLRDKISAQLVKTNGKTVKQKKEAKTLQVNAKNATRGKKRAADGTIVEPLEQDGGATTLTSGRTDDGDEELRAALKELGGTDEDLDLIAGAGSESELEGQEGDVEEKHVSKKKGSTLQNGIANILKEIALAQGSREQREQDSDASEAEDDQKAQSATSDKANLLPAKPMLKQSEKPSKTRTWDARLKCEPRADWYNISSPDVDLESNPKYTPSQQVIDRLHTYAKTLLTAENEAFKGTQQSSSSQSFYNTVIASGTLSDKISALTLAVQEAPLHNIKAFENLIALASKRGRGQVVDVLRALKDLLAQGSVLPGDRRLYAFGSQPALVPAFSQTKSWSLGDKLPQGLEDRDLICWAFEDWLKKQYFEILKILEIWCNDEIEFAKGRAISYVFELLKEKPEQESNLLRLLVNKLGDPVKKVASQTSYLLMQLLSTHPAMKMIVISAIEADFIFRPGQSMHAKYYAAVTLNQTALSAREEDVAQKLLSIYFSLFTTLLKPVQQEDGEGEAEKDTEAIESLTRAQRQRKKKAKGSENTQSEELREKMISAVLTGVNRAYPYVGTDEKDFSDHMETLFKITHSANFNTSIQAMLLIQQLTSTHSASSDRFYRTLYESLLDPRLITASKQQLYLNLLHRSLKADLNTKRVKAFVKRLLQTLSLHDPAFTCGVFFLLKDLEKTYPSLTALIDQAEDHENDEEVFRDVDEDASAVNAKATDDGLKQNRYDGSKRAPEYSNADNSCAWEVLPFLAHFHPSVTVSADHYMQHTTLPGKPDLTLHTLIHFLDRFVYRNPKLATNKLRGSSIMQPMASDDTHAVLISSTARQVGPAVNTSAFRDTKVDEVAADDAFFHKYFKTLGKETKDKKKKDREADEEGSVGDEGEDAVWKAMIDSAPDLEGEGSDDEDLNMSDFEGEMDGDEDSELADMDMDDEDEDEVDIEAGIFDDSDDEVNMEALALQNGGDSGSEFNGLDSDIEEDGPEEQRKEKKKADKDKRKKMKALPTFASADDYAKMLDDDEDEDLG